MTSTPADSREELEKLERKHAENPEGRYFVPLANAYRKNGELERAVALLRAGLERHPDYLSAHIVLGRCLADQQDGSGAEEEFRYVLTLDPQNLIALRSLGEIAMESNRLEESRRWYRDLLRVDPMNEDARRALTVIDERLAAAREAEEAGKGSSPSASDEVTSAVEVSTPEPPAPPSERAGGFAPAFSEVRELGEDEDEPDDFRDDSGAVVTETIAELYTKQGLYDRAAEVYGELIRRRGGDERLEGRLRQIEDLARGGSRRSTTGAGEVGAGTEASEQVGGRAPGELVGEPGEHAPVTLANEMMYDQSALADPFADSFSTGFPGLEARAEIDRGEGAMAAVGAGVESGETIRSFLRSVLAWTPAASPTVGELYPLSSAESRGAEIHAPADESEAPGDGPIAEAVQDTATQAFRETAEPSHRDEYLPFAMPAAAPTAESEPDAVAAPYTGAAGGWVDRTEAEAQALVPAEDSALPPYPDHAAASREADREEDSNAVIDYDRGRSALPAEDSALDAAEFDDAAEEAELITAEAAEPTLADDEPASWWEASEELAEETEVSDPLQSWETEPQSPAESDEAVGVDLTGAILHSDARDIEVAPETEPHSSTEGRYSPSPAEAEPEESEPVAHASDSHHEEFLFPWELPDPVESDLPATSGTPLSATSATDRVPDSDEPTAERIASVEGGSTPMTVRQEAENLPRDVPAPRSAPPVSRSQDDDDDLESFQAWLRSLKR